MKILTTCLFVTSLLAGASVQAKIPGLLVTASGDATSYGKTSDCFGANDQATAEALAQSNAERLCIAKNNGKAVQYTAFDVSRETTENPRPYCFTCETVASATFVCDPGL